MSLMDAFSAVKKNGLTTLALYAAAEKKFKTSLFWLDRGGDVNHIGTVNLSRGFIALTQTTNVGALAIEHRNNEALDAYLDRGLNPMLRIGNRSLFIFSLMVRNEDAALVLLERQINPFPSKADFDHVAKLADFFTKENSMPRILEVLKESVTPVLPPQAPKGP